MQEEEYLYKSNKFNIRHINPEKDAECYLAYMQTENVSRFISKSELPYDHASAIRELSYWNSLMHRGVHLCYAVENPKTKEIIGVVGANYYLEVHGRLEINYDLNPEFQGRGIATTAVDIYLNYIKNTFPLKRIQATVASHNERSLKLLKKLGFEIEGNMKKYGNLHGVFYDYYILSKVF
jgi:RimJ/RimL family protein N-acetyltransferase